MGHLFVVQADLSKLVVSDVVVGCDADFNFHRGFAGLFGGGVVAGTFPTVGSESHVRPSSFVPQGPGPWLVPKAASGSRVWLLDTSIGPAAGQGPVRSAEELVARITAAIESIAQVDRDQLVDGDHAPEVGTAKVRQRVGLTLMGIKEGGYRESYSAVIQLTIAALERLCDSLDLDIVLSLLNRADYAAVQHLRRRRPHTGGGWDAAEAEARRLAELAHRGELVLFIGSGASVEAGLRDWRGLLQSLAEEVGLELENPGQFFALDPRDQAMLIASSARASGTEMQTRIADAFQIRRYPLTQALLASLRLGQALTTNYDVLYESAYEAGSTRDGRKLQVLPREPYESGSPWLMKIHGDAQAPETIVLSRDDYIRFDAESIPMASVLQSAMITSHILFVGYSVTDENVVRLARQVVNFRDRHNRTPSGGEASVSSPSGQLDAPSVGTVLVPEVNELKRRLWDGVLGYVSLPSAESQGRDPWAESSRNVAIFLDLLGMHACRDAPYFLVDRYHELVGEADEPLREALLKTRDELARKTGQGPVDEQVLRLLEDLGARGS